MHELAITDSIMKIAIKEAEKNNFNKVLSIKIKIGEFSGVLPQLIQEYYNIVSEGTIAENANLVIEKIPVKIKCQDCNQTNEIDKMKVMCPDCKGTNVKIIAGREFYVDSIEVE